MKRRIETKVIDIENQGGESPRVILQCPDDETIEAKATVTTSPIMVEQVPLVAATNRINVVGKGRPSVHLGDTVEVQVVSTTSSPALPGAASRTIRTKKASVRFKQLDSTACDESDYHDDYGDHQNNVD